ncbi:MAG: hypothetical protein IPL46_27090 [Saprospiraceae bacterium]|nr:hypothetical protein [Saprospiraceae bacterium]
MNKTITDKIAVVLLFMLPLFGVIVSCYHAVNIPLLDDYNFVFGFLENYQGANSFAEKMHAIFATSNHMIFATFNLIVLLDFTLFGKVDFIHLIFFNNLLHLLFLFVLYRIFQQEQISATHFIPVALLLAAPNFAVQNWACYTAHVLGVVLTVATIWTLNRPGKKYFWGAIFLAILAVLSAGGGFLAFLAPIPILLTRHQLRERMIWGTFLTLILFAYAYWSAAGVQEFVTTEKNSIKVTTYVFNLILFFGSLFKSIYQEYHLWAGIFGVLIFGVLTAIILKRFPFLKMHPTLASGLVFALMLAALITLTRSQYGLGATTAYRYRLYQVIPLVFIYLYILIDQAEFMHKHFWSIMCCSLLFCGFRIQYNLSRLRAQNWQLESGLHNFVVTGASDQLSYHTPAKAAYWLNQMGQLKIFEPDQLDDSGRPGVDLKRAVHLQSMKLILDSAVDTTQYYQLKGWAFPSYSPSESLQIYVFVESGAHRYYYLAGPLLESQVLMSKASSGFVGLIDKNEISFSWDEARIGVALRHPFRVLLQSIFCHSRPTKANPHPRKIH